MEWTPTKLWGTLKYGKFMCTSKTEGSARS
uniref:Uncharacterized protein n=1 Tax=Anguilla anguilla TaxID=7936 RepID=A0A0E9V5M5_ANGAN